MLSSIIVDSQKLEKVVQLEVALKQRRRVEKPALEEQIAALERRRTELQRKLLDLDSDRAQLEKIRDAEMAIWQAKIAKQEELIQMAVKPEQREKLQLDLEIMKRQMERARIYYENRLAELEETMNFVRQDIDAITSQIEAMRRAAAS
jgi:chromosome segregation ATPase